MSEFRKQLEAWIEETGHSQKELASLSIWVRFRASPLDPVTFYRTLKKSPMRHDGRSNLYTVLTLIHAFRAFEENELKSFIERAKVDYQRDAYDWVTLWQAITKYANDVRERELEIRPPPPPPLPIPKWWIYIVLLLSLFLIAGLVVGFNLTRRGLPCSGAPVRLAPVEFSSSSGSSVHLNVLLENGAELPLHNVRSIAIDKHGLWVGYITPAVQIDGLTFFDGGQWHRCGGIYLNPGQVINNISFHNDSVFIAFDGQGVAQLASSGWTFTDITDGLPSNSVYELYKTSEQKLWAATFEGVAEFSDGKWLGKYGVNDIVIASNHIHTVLEDKSGDVWLGHIDKGISRLVGAGNWENFFAATTGVQNVRRSALGLDGVLWFATDGGGVIRVSNGIASEITTANGLPSDNVHDVEIDYLGRVWIATERGMAYTIDNGMVWNTYSSDPTWDIEFGCNNCPFAVDHMWFVVKGRGLGHSVIPPRTPTVSVQPINSVPILAPQQPFVFAITVNILDGSLIDSRGDGLMQVGTNLRKAEAGYPLISVVGEHGHGASYNFSNRDNPIMTPDAPGEYYVDWRVWQDGRFVTDTIRIRFIVETA